MAGYRVQVVMRLLPDQWHILRRMRLDGLLEVHGEEHPDYIAEAGFDELHWRALIATDPQFACTVHSVPAGLVSLRLEPGQVARVSFLWVDPSHRGSGVAEGLLSAVADWTDRAGMALIPFDEH